jgi:hypothetical protein
MITRRTLSAIALATTCLAPLAAHAQDFTLEPTPATAAAAPQTPAPFTGSIGVGVMGVMGSNANQAGRYTGLNTTGVDVLGDIKLNYRDPWDSGGTRYYSFEGNNLVLQTGNHLGTGIGGNNSWTSNTNNGIANNGSVELRIGDQGTWESRAYYDAITYTGNVIDSLYTVYGNQAVLNSGLTPWGGATASHPGPTTSYTVPQLQATGAMQPLQTGTRRDIFGSDFKYLLGDWQFAGAYSHEHKQGTLEESFDGPWGGTAFGLPVDYETDRFDATASYATHKFQALVQYTFSHFTDNNTYITLPYPTSNGSAPYQRSAAYSTPPSNEAHYLTMMLASNAVPATRINLNVRVGLEKQDDTFAPNTADPNPPASAYGVGLLNPSNQGTTANSLNAIATVYQVKLSASSRPLSDVDTRVYYGLDARDVTMNQYKVNVGGTGGSSDSSLVGTAYVIPQDWFKQNAGAEVGYRILPQYNTKLTVGYRLDAIDRSNAQVGHSWTNTATAAVSSEFGSQINGKLSFDYIDRSGVIDYVGPWGVLAGSNSSQTYSGAYYQVPLTAEVVTLRADYTPSPTWSSDMFLKFRNDNYNYDGNLLVGTATPATVPLSGTGGGVKQDYTLTFGPDVNYRPTKDLNIHLFYTYEQLFYNNLGNGACSTSNTGACAGSIGYFQNKDTSTTHTVGISADWQVNEKLKLRGDYTYSFGTVMFSQYNGVFVPNPTASYQNVNNYPDIDSTMHNVTVTATYQLRPNIELVAQGMFSYYHDNNWNDTANAIQGAGTSAISILTPGYSSPNYSIGMIMTGIRIKI